MLYFDNKNSRDISKKKFEEAVNLSRLTKTPCATAYMGLAAVYRYGPIKDNAKSIEYSKIAKNFFVDVVEKDPFDFWSWYGLGWCWSIEDDYKKAIEYTKKAKDIKDDFYTAHFNIACFYGENNQANECVAALKEILKPTIDFLKENNFQKDKDFQKVSESTEFADFCRFLDLPYLGSDND